MRMVCAQAIPVAGVCGRRRMPGYLEEHLRWVLQIRVSGREIAVSNQLQRVIYVGMGEHAVRRE